MSKNKKFYIARIEDDQAASKDQNFGKFISPYSGRNTTNKEVYPYVEYGNRAQQYQGLDGNRSNYVAPEDKYNPNRIPSYLRREDDNTGISRHSIGDLKGEKLTVEEMRRRSMGFYPREEDLKKEIIVEKKYENKTPYVTEEVEEEEYIYEEYDDFNDDIEDEEEYVKPVKSERKSELTQRPSFVDNNPTIGIKSESTDDFYSNELNFVHVSKEEKVKEEVKPTLRAKVEPVKQDKKFSRKKKRYAFPPLDILNKNGGSGSNNSDVNFQIATINSTLEEFRIGGSVIKYVKGPTVTQFEVKLQPGVRVNKIETISKNLQMNLATESIRIEAPIPGKASVGIEVPNPVKDKVLFGDLVSRKEYLNDGKPLNIVLGQQIDGAPKYLDITSMPHALVAGATGSSKTVCLYSIIVSILYKATPEEVKLILIDPKSNELTFFTDIPHLACPIIDDPKVATASIKWAVDEMQRRYALLKSTRKRTIVDYNNYVEETGDGSKMPYIVIVIDEFADLMNTVSDSFEDNVQRLTQKARSAGIHMIIATQRPSTDVIKGTIKANITTRIAFNVNSQIDSLTILDHVGADKLLGKGDMLYYNGSNDIRVQGSYITESEIEKVSEFLVNQNDVDYMFTLDELKSSCDDEFDMDEAQLFEKVARHVVTYRNASMNHLQRTFKIGYNTADTLMSQLEEIGVVSPVIPGRQRTVLVDTEELERILYNRR